MLVSGRVLSHPIAYVTQFNVHVFCCECNVTFFFCDKIQKFLANKTANFGTNTVDG